MSTRSRIGMLNSDGTVTSIYCHFDGYPEGVGRMLHLYWGESVRPLLALGDLSSLREVIGERHDFDAHYAEDDPRKKWCRAYGRDRGEEGCEACTHAKDEWPDSGQEYEYLWTGREWRYRTGCPDKHTRWRALPRKAVAA